MKSHELPCILCNKIYSDKYALKRHVDTVHQGTTESICRSCGRTFDSKEELKNHMKFHKLPCNLCNKIYSDKKALKRHVETVHQGKAESCEICGKKYKEKRQIKYHIMKEHPDYLFTQSMSEGNTEVIP